MLLKRLKNNKKILKLYINYKKNMSIFLTYIVPKKATEYVYKYYTGKKLNLKNPKEFNEKLQWLKLYGNQDLMVQCADKYAVRDYVKNKNCSEILNELYGVYDSPEEINFDTFPNEFVLKTTNGCGTNIICKNKDELDISKVKEKLRIWMKKKYGLETAETHYLKIKPRIICEKVIKTTNGTLPNDYKFFCFDGEPKFLYYGYDRENTFKKVHLNLDWEIIDITKDKAILTAKECKKPKCFNEMIKYARVLSEGIPFVRVDFYDSMDQVIFGEMTFTPTAGLSQIYTKEAASYMGDMIKLPKEEK